ncbi:unnamed protein product [Porites lobata]|uniref:Uncharacterized protein n=1 Tax=Porites lobata TaxID=104759 RepID=A0ABN8NWU4_9CNID|nr:unnamed protein product [Porites lobata]
MCTPLDASSLEKGSRTYYKQPTQSADVRGAGTRDEPLRTSAWEANTGDQGTYRNLRKIMALPLLPTIEITPMFMWLKRHVRTKPLQQLEAKFPNLVNVWYNKERLKPQNWDELALISSPLPCYQSVRLECTVVQYSGKMPVWAKVELLCINFDGLKVQFDEWPISLSKFQARLIDKAMEQFEESSCIFVRELTVWF